MEAAPADRLPPEECRLVADWLAKAVHPIGLPSPLTTSHAIRGSTQIGVSFEEETPVVPLEADLRS